MNRILKIALWMIVASSMGLAAAPVWAGPGRSDTPAVPGRMIVKYNALSVVKKSKVQALAVVTSAGLAAKKQALETVIGKKYAIKHKTSLSGKVSSTGGAKAMVKRAAVSSSASDAETVVYEFDVNKDVNQAVKDIKDAGGDIVAYAQPDYIMQTSEEVVPPSVVGSHFVTAGILDPYYASSGSWGQPRLDSWHLFDVNADKAWKVTKGKGVVVAVVDTGLDYNHPDIKDALWTNDIDPDTYGLHGYDFGVCADGDCTALTPPGPDVMDYSGHGTHVAGIIAARINQLGVVGVAPEASIMPLRALGNFGGTTSSLAAAIYFAVYHGADVINCSWGPGFSFYPDNPAQEEAVKFAYDNNVPVIFAAGNEAQDTAFYSPQDQATVITVGSTNWDRDWSYYSNWGEKIDISAPGEQILSLNARHGDNALSKRIALTLADHQPTTNAVVGEDYLEISGTSMAAPVVTGVVALMKANHPGLTIEDIRYILRASAQTSQWGPGFHIKTGYGIANAAAALTFDYALHPQITSPLKNDHFSEKTGPIVSITGSIGGNFKNFSGYQLFYSRGWSWWKKTPWTPIGPVVTSLPAGNVLAAWDIRGLAPDSYLIRLVATGKSTVNGVVTTSNFETVQRMVIDDPAVTRISGKTMPFVSTGLNDAITDPVLSDSVVAWMLDNTANGFDIAYNDLKSPGSGEQMVGGDYAKLVPHVSGRRIAWQDGGWGVYVYDVDHPVKGGTRITDVPWWSSYQLCGNRIVLAMQSNVVAGVNDRFLIYDIDTKASRSIDLSADRYCKYMFFWMSDKYIVYLGGADGAAVEPFILDIETGKSKKIDGVGAWPAGVKPVGNRSTGERPSVPIISGNQVLIPANNNNALPMTLYMYNIASGKLSKIKNEYPFWIHKITFAGNRIGFSRVSADHEAAYFCDYDAVNNVCEPHLLSTSSDVLSGVAVNADRAVWYAYGHGERNLYMADLKPAVMINAWNQIVTAGEPTVLSFPVKDLTGQVISFT
ncbi:MAG: S8 family serine peptidase, partial [Candidatus Omnitrophica bacterium]|nr:S8 family serine peptidase [Candidatus Omnitrophota bacterium]